MISQKYVFFVFFKTNYMQKYTLCTCLDSFCFCCLISESLSVTSVYSDMASLRWSNASFNSLLCNFSFSWASQRSLERSSFSALEPCIRSSYAFNSLNNQFNINTNIKTTTFIFKPLKQKRCSFSYYH